MSFSQTTDMNLIPQKARTEVYKGLKQGEYLKERLSATEEALEQGKVYIESLKVLIKDQEELIELQDHKYKSAEDLTNEKFKIKDLKIEQGEKNLKACEDFSKESNRKQLWKGIGIGTGVGVVLTAITSIILIISTN